MSVHVVWFKRDLRAADHPPLSAAAARGAVLPLYIAEPAYWQLPDTSGRQWQATAEALRDLREDLARCGQPLVVRQGDAVAVLEAIRLRHGIAALWSHELRWARTVRLLNPKGFLGLALTHPLAWALLALALAPGALTIGALALVLAARLLLAQGVDAALGVPGGWRRWAWLPLRDLFSAAVWAAAFWPGQVVWGEHRYRLGADGRMVETPRAP